MSDVIQRARRLVAACSAFWGTDWLSRCDWCGWPLAERIEDGCTANNCSQRPLPRRPETEMRQSVRALAALERELPRAD